jgi:hypothetical protein
VRSTKIKIVAALHLLTLLVTLVSFLIKISLFLNTFHKFPNPSFSIFVIYGVFAISWVALLPLHLLRLSYTLKIDYCNSLLLNLPATLINRLRLVLNSARAVTRTPKLHNIHITSILKSHHWLTYRPKSENLIRSSLSHLQISKKTGHPSYIRSLLSSPPHRSTRSSDLITLNRTSCLKLSNRSFYQSAPVLWNCLPSHLRHAAQNSTSSPTSDSCIPNLCLCQQIAISPLSHFLSSLIGGSPLFTGSATPRVRHSQGSDSIRICEVWMPW